MPAVDIASDIFGYLAGGQPVHQHTFGTNQLRVTALNYGALLKNIRFFTGGAWRSMILGFDKLGGYEADRAMIGRVVGRYANRIGGARFTLDGHEHRLTPNEGINQLHGGAEGLSHKLWNVVCADEHAFGLSLTSPAGEEGYPGNIDVTVRYEVDGGSLKINYHATTDEPSVINLTQHAYFNLSGSASIFDHQLSVAADKVVAVDSSLLATGEMLPVQGSIIDLRGGAVLSGLLMSDDDLIRRNRGLDYCYDVRDVTGPVAVLTGAYAQLAVYSDEPGLQVYTGNHLTLPFAPYAGICLETQKFPDTPNQRDFPSARFTPENPYHSVTRFEFRNP